VARAAAALADEFAPMTDLRGSASYRKRTAANLVRRFWLETRADDPLTADRIDVRASSATV
jgi:xanthine dehydrogenase small subunit